MLTRVLKLSFVPAALIALLISVQPAPAQTGAITGTVTDAEGKPVKGALIKIERQDIRGNYKVKTKKKGRYFHAGLPLGTYIVKLEIDGKLVDQASGVRVGLGDPIQVDFDGKELARRQREARLAAAGGTTQEEVRKMSEEERKKFEEQLKKRQEQISKNKELNEAFNAGMQAKQVRNYAEAVEQFKKALEFDPEQHVIWANLAEAQMELAGSKAGDDRTQLMNAGIQSYRKAIELQPESAAFHNNLGLALVKAGRLDDGREELAKAAELDPANAGRYFFNLGAIMVNTGRTDEAVTAFKRAIESDPTYADAYYQLGVTMVGNAEVQEDGSVTPAEGTVDAFRKYLELKPNGRFAASAQQMIASLTGKVDTEYVDPEKARK